MILNLLESRQLLLVSGKGGVGKTTVSCALARAWAAQFPAQHFLLLSTDPAHSLGDVLMTHVTDTATPMADRPNLAVRALDAEKLLQEFRASYGIVLETLVERGSFVQGEDLHPVWDLSWPGLNELMGILEIQRLLRQQVADRVIVDMAPTGHTLNLFRLMDFLDQFLHALELFQAKHRAISESLTGRYSDDRADQFLQDMKRDLATGRQLLHDNSRTACWVVAIPEPMSWLESCRLLDSLTKLAIPIGGLVVNRWLSSEVSRDADRCYEQNLLLQKLIAATQPQPVFTLPQQQQEPIGPQALDILARQFQPAWAIPSATATPVVQWPAAIPPGLPDWIAANRRLILIGGKGGVGKTTVAAAIAWEMACRYPDRAVRAISIDPAHSLGDALGCSLGHQPRTIAVDPDLVGEMDRPLPAIANLSAQEVDAEQMLNQFRDDYLWELAEMMGGDSGQSAHLQLVYGPEAWRQIVAQALPGIDEMLSLLAVVDLLDSQEQDLIILDTAPTGHLLQFLEMPTALADWLAWIFKLWIKYQDVLGRTDLMGRLRTLRQRVMQAQKKLKDANHTEFIGVFQNQQSIIAETTRLCDRVAELGISQRYLVHNRYQVDAPELSYPTANRDLTIVRLPSLPRSVAPLVRIDAAAHRLYPPESATCGGA